MSTVFAHVTIFVRNCLIDWEFDEKRKALAREAKIWIYAHWSYVVPWHLTVNKIANRFYLFELTLFPPNLSYFSRLNAKICVRALVRTFDHSQILIKFPLNTVWFFWLIFSTVIIFQTDGAIKINSVVIALDIEPHKSVITVCVIQKYVLHMLTEIFSLNWKSQIRNTEHIVLFTSKKTIGTRMEERE